MSKYHFLAVAAVLAGTALALPADDQYEFVNGQWVKSVPPAKGTPAGELAMIRNLIREGRNVAAVSAADKFLKAYPDSPLREEAMMLAGQAEINRDRYFQAYEWYKRQWEEYPNGQYAERTLQREFQIAEAFLKGKKRIVAYILYLPARQDGLDILNRIVEQAPARRWRRCPSCGSPRIILATPSTPRRPPRTTGTSSCSASRPRSARPRSRPPWRPTCRGEAWSSTPRP